MAKHLAKRWRIRLGERDVASITDVVRFAQIPPVLAKLLISRGVSHPNEVARHLDPRLIHLHEPNLLHGCARAAWILFQAAREGKKIAVYGDYDVDGMTATSILFKCLRMDFHGDDANRPIYFIPNRLRDGYGLNIESIRDLKERKVEVIVTVDCGITAVEEVALAKELGMTIIVTDHHQPGEHLPDADAIVHPDLFSHPEFQTCGKFEAFPDDEFLRLYAEPEVNAPEPTVHVVGRPKILIRYPRTDTQYPFAYLSGAGVAFKLAWALAQRFANSPRVGDRRQAFILEAISLAAIGTIADVVSLTDENRVIVVSGLKQLRTKPSVGLEALLKVSKLYDKNFFEAEDVGFGLAPRLNAAGRLEQAWLGVDLLTTDDPESARETAVYLDELNEKRRNLETTMQREATKQLKELYPGQTEAPPAIVLASHNWHPGVIGIVAGKLAERYNVPTVLIALSKTGAQSGTGSARGIPNVPEFNLHDALSLCSEHLERFGGHAGAAGLRIAASNVETFREAFCEVVERLLPKDAKIPELWIDSEEILSIFTLSAVQAINRLAPFGTDNPAPVFCTTDVKLCREPGALGKQRYDGDPQRPVHLILHVEQFHRTFRLVAFNMGEHLDELLQLYQTKTPIDVAFRPILNSFNGQMKVDFHLVDWRKHI
ncbi:MAG: DHH family phosphoesterase [Thermoguttaceae bacterium]|nr:DHH family phosphoesterase [Thermoguttaceae bacterium]